MSRSALAYWIAALLIAWAVDFFFWDTPPGVSYFLWMLLAVASALILAWRERVKPAPSAYLFAGLALLLAGLTVVRAEPLTRFLGFTGGLGLLILFAMTFRTSSWVRFGILDFAASFVRLAFAGLARPSTMKIRPTPTEQETEVGGWRSIRQQVMPYLRGLLLALPVVLILGALLSSADPVFGDRLKTLYAWFDVERLPEYLLRFIFIAFLTYLFTGVLAHALQPQWETKPGWTTSRFKPFLGATETTIVLASVNLLFAFFVAFQFRYLFGGEANITTAGYTYAEYARRGFSELVVVAVLSIGLYHLLASITRLETSRQQRLFSGLAVLLVALVMVILVSAMQRLMLYQDAYGFTRLRTYTWIFIPWVGALLLAAALMQIFKHREFFATALGIFGVGFALTLGLLNVDALIVHQNVSRARLGQELDGSYLVSLSTDAVPAMVEELQASQNNSSIAPTLAGALSCRTELNIRRPAAEPDWRSYHISIENAERLLRENQPEWAKYPVDKTGGDWHINLPGGERVNCQQWYMD